MSGIVEAIGKLVTAQIPHDPAHARDILCAAYRAVALRGKLLMPRSMPAVTERFNGTIAQRIVAGLTHPERAVIVNIYMPCEIFEAMGLVPLFPEGVAVYVACTSCSEVFTAEAEARGVPESYCSYHKTMLGMVETGVIRKPLMVAATSLACDANQLSFRAVAAHTGAPFMLIDVPHTPDEEAVAYVEEQLITMTAMLEEMTGRQLDFERLSAVLARSNQTFAALRGYRAARGAISLDTSMTGELCTLIATHCMLGTEPAQRYSEELYALARKEHEAARHVGVAGNHLVRTSSDGPRPVPRIYWMHTLPNWQMRLRAIFDDRASAELVGCDIANDYLTPMDFRNPFRALARRIVDNVANGSGNRRVEHVVREATSLGADGVVIFCQSGCKQTLGLATVTAQALREAGIAALVLDGDGCDGHNVAEESMLTRIEAFLESLEVRL